jgi:hypothetical protein
MYGVCVKGAKAKKFWGLKYRRALRIMTGYAI